jgi:hypothetical protein
MRAGGKKLRTDTSGAASISQKTAGGKKPGNEAVLYLIKYNHAIDTPGPFL